MFSQYSSPQFEVEPVVVTADGNPKLYPDLSLRTFEVDMAYVNRTIGTSLTAKEVRKSNHRVDITQYLASESLSHYCS